MAENNEEEEGKIDQARLSEMNWKEISRLKKGKSIRHSIFRIPGGTLSHGKGNTGKGLRPVTGVHLGNVKEKRGTQSAAGKGERSGGT